MSEVPLYHSVTEVHGSLPALWQKKVARSAHVRVGLHLRCC